MKRLLLTGFSALIVLPLLGCAQTAYVTTTDYRVATVTIPQTGYVTSTVTATVSSPPLTSTATTILTPAPVTATYTVTAPPVTATVTKTLTVTTTPPTTIPPPLPIGMLIANFSGTGSQRTGIFTPSTGNWYIQYTCQRVDPSNADFSFTFSAYHYQANDDPPVTSKTVTQPDSSSVFLSGLNGTFYIDVVASNATWTILISQL